MVYSMFIFQIQINVTCLLNSIFIKKSFKVTYIYSIKIVTSQMSFVMIQQEKVHFLLCLLMGHALSNMTMQICININYKFIAVYHSISYGTIPNWAFKEFLGLSRFVFAVIWFTLTYDIVIGNGAV